MTQQISSAYPFLNHFIEAQLAYKKLKIFNVHNLMSLKYTPITLPPQSAPRARPELPSEGDLTAFTAAGLLSLL